MKYIDPTGEDAVSVVFPDYKISAFGTKWSNLGHAGVLLLNNKTGAAQYFEYGRYDAKGIGIVRTYTLPKLDIGKDGFPTDKSLTRVLGIISNKSGQGGKISGAYITNDNFNGMKQYAIGRMNQNNNPNREEYDLQSNNCNTFLRDTLKAGKVDTPWMVDPRPNSYADELRGSFTPLDYSKDHLQFDRPKSRNSVD